MAGGINPLGNTPGKVDSNNNLLVAIGAGSVLPNGTAIDAGTGTADATLGGTLAVSTTSAGTPASLTETDLWSYSMPANTLSADGKGVYIEAWGTKAANGNSVTPRLYFGGTLVTGSDYTTSGDAWFLSGRIVRTGATAHESLGSSLRSSALLDAVRRNTITADTTAAIIIKVTGQNGTASANDMVFRGARVMSF